MASTKTEQAITISKMTRNFKGDTLSKIHDSNLSYEKRSELRKLISGDKNAMG